MVRMQSLLVAVVVAAVTSAALAGEKLDVPASLAKPIIDPKLPLKEVEDFTEARVPPMPEVKTVAEWEKYAEQMRRATLDRVVFRGEAAKWRDAETKVEWLETIDGGPGYRIKKLRYEALPGLWIPALLYEPEKLSGKVPVFMNVNGHDGKGKAADYKQIRCINQVKRGILALNVEWLGMGQLRGAGFVHYCMNQIDLCGTSGLAPFYLSMKRGLDVLLSLPNADPQRVGVAGLSGGGWQTIIISSLDERVTLSDPVAGYSSFRTRVRNHSDLGDSEQTPVDLATTTDYAQLTALRAPRPTLLTFNSKDNCCFASGHALQPLLDAAGPIFKLYGKPDNLRWHVNEDPGTHNFLLDNRQALYRMIGDHFYTSDKSFDPKEIPSDKEVKTAEQLKVELPEDNADFHKLAMALCKDLPRNPEIPTDAQAASQWREQRRKKLAEIVQARQYDVQAGKPETAKYDDGSATFLQLKLGTDWTVPAVELVRGEPKATVILVADGGRKSAAAEADKLLQAGNRVLAVDPFYFGESKIASRDFLFGLLVSAVGERPLGLQASQLAAIARWSKGRHPSEPVTLHALGPRSSLFALVAGVLEEKAIAELVLSGSFKSLKDVITQNKSANQAPELFCFGLLEEFDIPQLTALVAPRPVQMPGGEKQAP